jgi:hypothetical protein
MLLVFAPVNIVSTRQADFISKWNETYNKTNYMFQVIDAQISDDVLRSFNSATPQVRERMLVEIIKPYLRLNTQKNVPGWYKPKYMNKARVYNGQTVYFTDMFYVESKEIVGIKQLPHSGEKNDPIFIMMFDMNGFRGPNRWGKDIFGINVYSGGKIAPLGQDLMMHEHKTDCSDSGTGVFCSYYYIIGGGFIED